MLLQVCKSRRRWWTTPLAVLSGPEPLAFRDAVRTLPPQCCKLTSRDDVD